MERTDSMTYNKLAILKQICTLILAIVLCLQAQEAVV